ncbi:MAG: putative peptide zinc metalloprotease protein [Gammaproteobacteria bacterium]|jgi:putative peptide zinc metalloprotease protein
MASEPFFDPSWYRVAELKPRLRSHVRLYRHHYRGDLWYVMQDNTTGRYHRFTQAANQVIGLMDGERTIDQIWRSAADLLGDDAPTQGETIRLLYQLHTSDALQSDIPPDMDELLRRYDETQRNKWKQNIKSPLAIRIPLVDPERFLNATMWLVKPLFGPIGALLWLLVVGFALVLAGVHWTALTENITERALAPQNLLVIWLVFPLVKILHELGHAYSVKRWGGEVHQIGMMLLVLTPVPYVDASAASVFRERWRRAFVGAAGMLTEGFVAAIALLVWVQVEPGLVRLICFNVMLIAGVSTLLFNGNPLLRFDAYYILSDLIEIPNLGSRANRYIFYLIQRYAFGMERAESPVLAKGERGWFVFYAIGSFIYRMMIYVVITTFVAGKFFLIGVLLAIWSSYSMLGQPLFKGLKFLVTNSSVRRYRRRAYAMTSAFFAVLLGIIVALPLPLATQAEGIVWVHEHALVRAGAEGFIVKFSATPGTRVNEGEPVLHIEDPLLPAEVEILRHERDALNARLMYFQQTDRVQADIIGEEIERNRRQLEQAQAELAALVVRAPTSGVLIIPNAEDMEGRFVKRGQELAYVADQGTMTVRVVVPQDDVDLVRTRTNGVELRFTEAVDQIVQARIAQAVPSAVRELPSPALGSEGGGIIPIDPRDPSGRTAFSDVFQFDLALAQPAERAAVGTRVYVRFDHGSEALAKRWYRSLRQLFLSQFDV